MGTYSALQVGATPVAARMFCNSPVPTTASTSGIRWRISSRKRSTRQPATTTFFARPEVLCSTISKIVFTDSCCALSMKEHVFTTITSASSARGRKFGSGLSQKAHHYFAVDQILRTS